MRPEKAVVATHTFVFGTSQALRMYFERKGCAVMFIEHALFGNVFSWLFGAFDTFFKVASAKGKFDIYVGSNNLNAFVGLLCKRIGKVEKVVYFSPDYSAQRFNNGLLNGIYHWMDRVCVKHCDITWNSSAVMNPDPMMLAREDNGFPIDMRKNQIQVPDGTDDRKILPIESIHRKRIGFIGHLRSSVGCVELIEIFKKVRKKVPEAELLLMGSGPLEGVVRDLSKDIPGIEVTGHEQDINVVYDRLSMCAVAVAPYLPGTISQYTDPGKIKVYLSVGLPIVITKVPLVARDIVDQNCGFAIEPEDDDAFVEALVKLLTDDELYKKQRENVIRMKQYYSWDNIFDRALMYLYDRENAPASLY